MECGSETQVAQGPSHRPTQKAFHRLAPETQAFYDAATRALQEQFEPKSRMTQFQAEFEFRSKKLSEGWADLADNLCSLSDKDLQHEDRERLALQNYLRQLEQPQVAFSVKQRHPVTLDNAVAATLEMESYVAPPLQGIPSVSTTSEGPTASDS